MDLHPNKTITSSALTPSPASTQPLSLTHGTAEGTPLDLAPPAFIYGPALRALTPPSVVRTTSAPPLRPAQPAPAYLPLPAPRPNRVTFGPRIAEALPYATLAQAPYPPLVNSPMDDLAATAKATAREILKAHFLLLFLASKKRNTLGGLPKVTKHPAAALLQSYAYESIPAHTAPMVS